ncbi:MAG: hypothetical protein AB1921_08310 [Thermodesulfobacteriota bacterium]
MEETMTSDRVGVITFFGILVPGAYLAGIIILCISSGIELFGLQGHSHLIKVLSQQTALFAGVFLFVAYLLGVLVRLFAPEFVDFISEWYLVQIRKTDHDWAKDKFPYESTLRSRLQNDGMGKITELMSKLNSSYGKERNTPFFNYCKWFIDANNSALSRQVQEAEALVRFLSGTTLVLLIALPVALFFIPIFIAKGSYLIVILYSGLLAMDTISLLLILERFKYQRRREVVMVWGCVYLIINSRDNSVKGVPTPADMNAFFGNS